MSYLSTCTPCTLTCVKFNAARLRYALHRVPSCHCSSRPRESRRPWSTAVVGGDGQRLYNMSLWPLRRGSQRMELTGKNSGATVHYKRVTKDFWTMNKLISKIEDHGTAPEQFSKLSVTNVGQSCCWRLRNFNLSIKISFWPGSGPTDGQLRALPRSGSWIYRESAGSEETREGMEDRGKRVMGRI